jgi:hypothetical protein
LIYKGSIVFDRYLYPGYVNRKVLDKKSFPLHDARIFIFKIDDKENLKSILLQSEIIKMDTTVVKENILNRIDCYKKY